MNKICFACLCFIVIAQGAMAQDSAVAVPRNRYFNVDFGVGYMRNDLGDISRFLSRHGYNMPSENALALSISPSVFMNRFVFRGEVTLQVPVSTDQANGLSSTFQGKHVGMSVGYMIVQTPKLRIYPYVGISAFTSKLTVEGRSNATTIDGLVNQPQRGFSLTYANAALDAGIQIDRVFELKNKPWHCAERTRYMTVGLRMGYLYGPGPVAGRYNGSVVEGAPAYAPRGPYVKLVIGFSSKARGRYW